MKLMYFERKDLSVENHWLSSPENVVYAPEEQAMLCNSRINDYSLITNPNFIWEAQRLMEDGFLAIEGVAFSNIRFFEMDDTKVKGLVQSLKERDTLESKVKKGAEEVFDVVKQIEYNEELDKLEPAEREKKIARDNASKRNVEFFK